MRIPVLYGSMREGRKSEAVAKFVHAELLKRGIESEYVTSEPYRDREPLERKHPEPWKSIMESADGLIVVAPEYNHGYPGQLKEMIDALTIEYNYKPVGFVGAGGYSGGSRAVEQLRQVMIELRMVPIREALYFPMVWELLNDKGELKNPELFLPRLETFLKELFWYAEALKEGREKHPWSK
ncbi:MAG: NAD(P)H-dependent oxidoreductase [Patescibacteria group bacterium]|nr:NAD(P)H-dependent oxidoreductase [Patescibacteria group bacterium]